MAPTGGDCSSFPEVLEDCQHRNILSVVVYHDMSNATEASFVEGHLMQPPARYLANIS